MSSTTAVIVFCSLLLASMLVLAIALFETRCPPRGAAGIDQGSVNAGGAWRILALGACMFAAWGLFIFSVVAP